MSPGAHQHLLDRILGAAQVTANAVASGGSAQGSGANALGGNATANATGVSGGDLEIFAQASEDNDELLIADFDLDRIDEVRSIWQFYRDRRPETYGKLTEL